MDPLTLTGCTVDLATGEVVRGSNVTHLTGRERELFCYLVARAERDVPRDELLTEVWGYAPTAQTRAIDNMVRKLRAKIEIEPERPRHLLTVSGGYRFRPEPLPTADRRFPTRFIGREETLAEIEDALTRHPVVMLCGPPGVGKTRTAWEVARGERFGSVSLCELRESVTEEEVLGAVSQALGIVHAGANTIDEMRDRIEFTLSRKSPMLLLLDNAEQLEAGALGAVATWTQLGGVRVLVTSRHPRDDLDLVRIDLDGLAPETAAALFMDRALKIWPAFVPSPSVDDLCAQLGGLPLAIELAAARTGVMTADEMRDRLAKGALFGRGLEAALTWSWGLLTAAEQEALCQCSVFVGGFDAAAVSAVVHVDSFDAIELVSSLIDKFLIRTVRTGDSIRMELFLGVATFINGRDYDLSGAIIRHIRWFESQLADPTRTIHTDTGNCIAAFQRALRLLPIAAAKIVLALDKRIAWRVPAVVRLGWFGESLHPAVPLRDRVLLRSRIVLCKLLLGQRDAEQEQLLLEREAREGGDFEQGIYLLTRGQYHSTIRQIEPAREAYSRAFARAEELTGIRRHAAMRLGSLCLSVGDPTEAERWYRAALDCSPHPTEFGGGLNLYAQVLIGLSITNALLGRQAEGLAFEQEALAETENESVLRIILWMRAAESRWNISRWDDGVEMATRALTQAEIVGERVHIAHASLLLGRGLLHLGEFERASVHLSNAQRHFLMLRQQALADSVLIWLDFVRYIRCEQGKNLRVEDIQDSEPYFKPVRHIWFILATDRREEADKAEQIALSSCTSEQHRHDISLLLTLRHTDVLPPEVAALKGTEAHLTQMLHAALVRARAEGVG